MTQTKFASLIVTVATGLALAGCGKRQEPLPAAPPSAPPAVSQPAPPPSPPAPPVQPAVTPAPAPVPEQLPDLLASTKIDVEKAYALAKESKYQEALALLQQRAVAVQGNPEAKQLIDSATVKIKQMMAEAATKAATEKAGETAGNTLNKLLGK
jgi:hypothetical protein